MLMQKLQLTLRTFCTALNSKPVLNGWGFFSYFNVKQMLCVFCCPPSRRIQTTVLCSCLALTLLFCYLHSLKELLSSLLFFFCLSHFKISSHTARSYLWVTANEALTHARATACCVEVVFVAVSKSVSHPLVSFTSR